MQATQEGDISLEELYGKVFATWGSGPGLYGLRHTPESFAGLPEEKRVSLLIAIASLNPGYWAEKVIGKPVEITQVIPRIDLHGKDTGISIVMANIPRAKVQTKSGVINI